MHAADLVRVVVYQAARRERAEIVQRDLLVDLPPQTVHEPVALAVDLVHVPADAEAHFPVQPRLAALVQPRRGKDLAAAHNGDVGDDLLEAGVLLRLGTRHEFAVLARQLHDLGLAARDETAAAGDGAEQRRFYDQYVFHSVQSSSDCPV